MVRGRRSAGCVRRRVVQRTLRETGKARTLRNLRSLRSRWLLTVSLAVVTLVSGCTVAVGGKAQPAHGLAPRSLAGPTLTRVLLDHDTLSRILKQPMILDYRFPPRFGGPEALQAQRSAAPSECLGVAEMLEQAAYHPGTVTSVAVQAWRHAAVSPALTQVKEGVVSLPTAADANTLFAAFSQQWQSCAGRTQPLPEDVFRLKAMIDQVHVAGSVLGASVWLALASSGADADSIPAGRAIGVRGNCLVEVEVDFFNASHASLHGQGVIINSAQDVAQTIMDRIGALVEPTPR